MNLENKKVKHEKVVQKSQKPAVTLFHILSYIFKEFYVKTWYICLVFAPLFCTEHVSWGEGCKITPKVK